MVSFIIVNTAVQAKPLKDYTDKQIYLFEPRGINAEYAWGIPGGRGKGVRIIDVEPDWNLEHRDLVKANPLPGHKTLLIGDPPDLTGLCESIRKPVTDHGTAVLGILVSNNDDRLGTSGIVPESEIGVVAQVTSMGDNLEAAILRATKELDAGDILVIEAQVGGPRHRLCECGEPCDDFGLVPVEFLLFEPIKEATTKGIIVVEAAANGSQNLDDPIYEGKFDRNIRDSGAILVGAGTTGRNPRKYFFSNYGRRVDLQAWGDTVITTGYGDLFPGDKDASNPAFANELYTRHFSGTSSATAIIAGAAAALQGVWKAQGNQPLSPTCLRNILVATGTPQAFPERGNVGPRPNLKAAINEGLKNIATLCANVYVSSFTNGTIIQTRSRRQTRVASQNRADRLHSIYARHSAITIATLHTG